MSVLFPASRLSLSKLGYGAMGITAFYGAPMEDDAALALLKGVYDSGITHFDTAEVYKSGTMGVPAPTDKYNETILGKFFATVPRDSYTVATKFMPGLRGNACDLATVEGALDASLGRLGLNFVDLYYCHRMPESLEQLEDWMKSVSALVAKGKIKNVGLSEVGPQWLRKANSIHPVACIQQEWSLLTRDLEDTLVPVCKELGIGIVAYSPLARNLLTLTKDSAPVSSTDWRASQPRYQGENFEKNKELAQQLADVAKSLNATSAQLSLAWLYRRAEELGVPVVPIPGSTKLDNVLSNFVATKLQLSDADYKLITEMGKQAAGSRATEQYEKMALGGQLQKPF
eukprot:PhF_6_TR8631/c0_g1_i1/m.13471